MIIAIYQMPVTRYRCTWYLPPVISDLCHRTLSCPHGRLEVRRAQRSRTPLAATPSLQPQGLSALCRAILSYYQDITVLSWSRFSKGDRAEHIAQVGSESWSLLISKTVSFPLPQIAPQISGKTYGDAVQLFI